jgi:hypothetical protein
MNCQEFWDSYPELSHPDQQPDHAGECEAFARRLGEQRLLTAGLRAAAAEWRAMEAPAHVEDGLVAAFRSRLAVPSRPHRIWLPVLTWASAAVVLVTLALFVVRGRPPVSPRRTLPRAVELAAVAAPFDWASDDDAVSGIGAAGDFIPLPNAEQVGENEAVNVVRVEVPRSAMLAVGLPVSVERASELVEADVMLGSDGLARAVRFVNE